METKTKGNTCKLITGLFNQTVNQFQDESVITTRGKLQQIKTTPEPGENSHKASPPSSYV